MLTQEEWNEKQRAERKTDFSWDYDDGIKAPKSTSSNNCQHIDEDDQEDDDDEDMVGPSMDMFIPPSNPNRQSTITSKSFKRYIHNELDDEPADTKNKQSYDDSDLDCIPLPNEPRTGTEIAPPPTYEYYGPSGRGPKVQEKLISVNEMQDSICKGFTNIKNVNKPRPVRGIVDDDDDDDK